MEKGVISHLKGSHFCKSIVFLICYIFLVQSCIWMMPPPSIRHYPADPISPVEKRQGILPDVADVSAETLSATTLGSLRPGARLNLEKALTLNTRLGGHLVSGHVDGIGRVVSSSKDGRSIRFGIEAPTALAHYIAKKGSICVDGTSLTVNAVNGSRFESNVVPHTLVETIMSGYRVGTLVNLEVDLIARYLERLLSDTSGTQPNKEQGLTLETMVRYGFNPKPR